jgi:[acyl-carrier-protein] S-malonyltransferase
MGLALLFAGQGAQKTGMGKSLYAGSPAARTFYDEANRILGWDLTQVSFEGPDTALTPTKVCQPALYVHGLALLAALREQGKASEINFALGLDPVGEVEDRHMLIGFAPLRGDRVFHRQRGEDRRRHLGWKGEAPCSPG